MRSCTKRLLSWLQAWSATAFQEAQEHDHPYRSSPALRIPLRVALLLAFCAVFAAWVVYDAAAADQGFSSGVRDSAYVDTTADTQEALALMAKGRICFCPCQLPDVSSQPVAYWKWNVTDHPYLVWAWACDPELVLEQGTKEYGYVRRYMEALLVNPLRISNTPFLLTPEAWKAARFQAFVDKAQVVQAVLQLELTRAIFDADSADNTTASQEAQKQAQEVQDKLLMTRASLAAVYATALELPASFQDVIIVNPTDPDATPSVRRCDVAEDTKPLVRSFLVDACQDNASRARDCDNAYDAYTQWCAPGMCSCIKPRQPYQKFVQVAAVLGGVYSSCAVTMYLVWLVARMFLDGGAMWGSGVGGSGGGAVAGGAAVGGGGGDPLTDATDDEFVECEDGVSDVFLHAFDSV